MLFYRDMMVLMAMVSICMAQAVDINGTVKDASTNAAIQGAIVKLLHTSYVKPDTTDAAGAFRLTGQPAAVTGKLQLRGHSAPVMLNNGEISFTLHENQPVSIATFTSNGARLSSVRGMRERGSYTVTSRGTASGVSFTRVSIGSDTYYFRSMAVAGRTGTTAGVNDHSWQSTILTKQATFPDTISVTCAGYASKTMALTNPVTSNVAITLTKQTGPAGMKLIAAKNLSFQMGQAGFVTAVHTVTFDHDIWMDTTEVTQDDYQALMGANPSIIKGTKRPVENINICHMILYCNKRSKRDGYDTAYRYTKVDPVSQAYENVYVKYRGTNVGYRLPSEAEWEYACRAGTSTLYYWGNGVHNDYAWWEQNSNDSTHTVATKKPNAWGLYDMSGNVWEVTNDSADADNYPAQAVNDPPANEYPVREPWHRWIRGGCYQWQMYLQNPGSSAGRNHFWFDSKGSTVGFRCALRAQ
jgi:formylglycine-generating enzyme required for sulfatase activity